MSVSFLPDVMTGEAPTRVPGPVIPRLPPVHVARPRLAGALLASDCRLRLICAPAGFGKSVLMSECASQVPDDTLLVWLDIGGRPLSIAQLYLRLAAALGHPPAEGQSREDILRLLGHVRQPLWIMLDDYPRQPSPELDDCLDMLLEFGPERLDPVFRGIGFFARCRGLLHRFRRHVLGLLEAVAGRRPRSAVTCKGQSRRS